MPELLRLVTLINDDILFGSFQIHGLDGESPSIRFFSAIDVEDAAFEPQHIENLVLSGFGYAEHNRHKFEAVLTQGMDAVEAMQLESES